MSRLEVLREIAGDDAVRDLVQNALDDLSSAVALLDQSIAAQSIPSYRDCLHFLQNTAGEVGLEDLLATIQAERNRVLAAPTAIDDRLRPGILQAAEALRLLCP